MAVSTVTAPARWAARRAASHASGAMTGRSARRDRRRRGPERPCRRHRARAGRAVRPHLRGGGHRRRRLAVGGADPARVRPRPVRVRPPAGPRVTVLPLARPRAARPGVGAAGGAGRARAGARAERRAGAATSRPGDRRCPGARDARRLAPAVRTARPRVGPTGAVRPRARGPAATPSAADGPVRPPGRCSRRRDLVRLAFRDAAQAGRCSRGMAAHSMLRLGSPLSAGRSGSCWGRWRTRSAGRWRAAAAARSPPRSRQRLARWAWRSCTGHRVDALADLPPARAVLLDLTPRQVLAIAGDRLPAGYRRQLEAVPLRARRVQDRLGARRTDPVERPGHGTGRHRPSRRPVRRGRARPRTRSAAGRHCGPAVRPARPADDRRPVPRAGGQARRVGVLPRPQRLDRRHDGRDRGAGGALRARLPRPASSPEPPRTPAAMEAYDANYVGGDINGGLGDWRQLLFRPGRPLEPVHDARPRPLPRARRPRRPGGGVHGMSGSSRPGPSWLEWVDVYHLRGRLRP